MVERIAEGGMHGVPRLRLFLISLIPFLILDLFLVYYFVSCSGI